MITRLLDWLLGLYTRSIWGEEQDEPQRPVEGQGPRVEHAPGEPPREGVCAECWGWSFHRDGCSQDDGKPRPEAFREHL